jgi:class 3 adenylate cyclase
MGVLLGSQSAEKGAKNSRPRRISDRLSEAAKNTFIGRQRELSLLTQAIESPDPPFIVAFIHGPGGIGKSRLIEAVLSGIESAIDRYILKCREIEPTPQGATDLRVEPATSGDGMDIRIITESSEPPESARLIKSWWERHPETFMVVRSHDGGLTAFYILFEPQNVDQTLLEEDLITSVWLQHLRENSVADGERVLFCRRWLDRRSGEMPSAAVSACFLDIKRAYMELRPSLRRIYFPVIDLPTFEQILFPLGFTSLQKTAVIIDGFIYHSLMNDFGPSSVDGWLTKIVGAELGLDSTEKDPVIPDKVINKPSRQLLTILFTDIVGSSERVSEIGDQRWRDLLERHHILIRTWLARFGGHEVDTAGDGFFATFDKPISAIHCAYAIQEAIQKIRLKIRIGLHLGECEVVRDAVRGIAVHIAARVAARAEAGEVWVSSTIKDATAGSEIRFEHRGAHALKGIPGEWNLFVVKK